MKSRETPPSVSASTKQAVSPGQSLMQKTQAAARLAAISAEKAKVLNVDVPRLHATLGKSIYDDLANKPTFPEHFKILDALSEQIAEASKKSFSETEGTSFSDKAKALGAKGVQYAVSQKLAMQRTSQYLQLGKTAYEMPGKPAAASPVSQQIDQLLERVAAIEEEATGLGKAAGTTWLSPKKMLSGSLAIVALMCVLFVVQMMRSSSKPYYKYKFEADEAEHEKDFEALVIEADALWDSEKKPEAVDKYVTLLDKYCGYGERFNQDKHKPELARASVRAIDDLVSSGNTEAAKRLIILADQSSLTLVFRNPESNKLVAAVRAEKKLQDKQSDIRRSQQPAAWPAAGHNSETFGSDNGSTFSWGGNNEPRSQAAKASSSPSQPAKINSGPSQQANAAARARLSRSEPEPDIPAVKQLKRAGTWTPEAERHARELHEEFKKMGVGGP